MDTRWFWPAGPPFPSSHNQQPDDPRLSSLGLPLTLPYEVETLGEMDERLEVIAVKLVECVKAREWGLGFRMWDSALSM
jgi:proteasome activator subunit 4